MEMEEMMDKEKAKQMWLSHAYDRWHCGDDVYYLAPDGNLYNVIRLQPIDRFQTAFRLEGWSTLDSTSQVFTLDEYQDVLVLSDN